MATYHEFDEESIANALSAIEANGEISQELSAAGTKLHEFSGGEFSVLAQCISLKTANHRICLIPTA